MVEVDKAHAALGQPPGEQAIGSIRTVARFGPVHVEDVFGFLGDIHQFGDRCLHAESHFVGRDSGRCLGISDDFVAVTIEGCDGFYQIRLGVSTNSLWVVDVMDGVTGGIELHALVSAREKACSPLPGGDGLWVASSHAGHDHEPG